MRRPSWLVIVAFCVGACGGRSLPAGQHDGGVRDGAVGDAFLRDGPTDGPYFPDTLVKGYCTQDDECTVAVRTDNCCEAAYPDFIWNIDFGGCVIYWWAYGTASITQECMDEWDPQCAYIDCMPAPPPSRVARCDQGHCEFALECSDPSACVLVINSRECCPCPQVVPQPLYDQDSCLVKYPQGDPAPSECYPQACPAMPCQECKVPAVSCLQQTCQGVFPL